MRVVTDPDAVPVEMCQVPTDTATQLKHDTEGQPADCPAAGTLDIECLSPARPGSFQDLRVFGACRVLMPASPRLASRLDRQRFTA